MLNKELIIQKCREDGAYMSEFRRFANCKTDKEFAAVLLDNLGWLKDINLIQYIDTEELAKYIENNNEWIYNIWIYKYCKYVEDRKELWSNLTEGYWIYNYCKNIKDRPELWPNLTEDRWIYEYCKDIKDREELWTNLTEDIWINNYCQDVEDRPELRIKLKGLK